MGSQGRAKNVVGPVTATRPGAQGLVHRLFEGALPGFHGDDLRAEEPHARHVGRLAGHVGDAHVHRAVQAQPRAGRGSGHTVLPCARFRDDLCFAHAPGEDCLRQGIVDLVGPGVGEVLALQEQSLQPQCRGEPGRGSQWGGPSHKVPQFTFQLGEERWIRQGRAKGGLQIEERLHEGFRGVAAAESLRAEA